MAYIPKASRCRRRPNAAELHRRSEVALHDDEAEQAFTRLVRELYAEGLDEAEVLGLMVAVQARRRALEEAAQPKDERVQESDCQRC